MKLVDIIEKAKSKKIPSQPDPRNIDPEWERSKDYLDSWSADFEKALQNHADEVRISKSGKRTRMCLPMGQIDSHQVELIVYQSTEIEGEMTASYAMYNRNRNACYLRKLL